MKHRPSSIVSIALLAGVLIISLITAPQAQAQTSTRVFEMRTYTTHEGKLEDLLSRFRNLKVQSVFMDPTNFSSMK
ncbi:MAG TPA: hypothetical protein VFI62_12070 [Burkholderiales bacterium]|nr:hypothetical protein [Burkholderiales bacterium]